MARTVRCSETTRAGRMAKAQQFWSAAQTVESFADDEASITDPADPPADRHGLAPSLPVGRFAPLHTEQLAAGMVCARLDLVQPAPVGFPSNDVDVDEAVQPDEVVAVACVQRQLGRQGGRGDQ